MGSTPTHVVKADLNGSGVLVDISGFVDLAEGISARAGRSDWTADQPPPGSLDFILENLDGRFTPGQVATYSPGMVIGTLVEWTCSDGLPAQTVTDEYARADSTLDGSNAADGNASKAWSTLSTSGASQWQIASGKAKVLSGAEDSLAVVDPGRTNITITAQLAALHGTAANIRAGVVFRVVDKDNYWTVRVNNAIWDICKVVAGVQTSIITGTGTVPAAGDVVVISLATDQLSVTVNGASYGGAVTFKMTDHLSATKVGFYGRRYSTGVVDQDAVSSWERLATSAPNVRARRYRVSDAPELSFPNGVASSSVVAVSCLDALAILASRRMRQMVDEVAFTVTPVAYWPLADSGTQTGSTAQAEDISGNAEAPLLLAGNAPVASWAAGVGPSTDGRAAIIINPDATSPPVSQATYLTPERALGTSGKPVDWASPNPFPGRGYGISIWFSIRPGIYSPGDSCLIATLSHLAISWDATTKRIRIFGAGAPGPSLTVLTDVPTVTPGDVAHIFLATQQPTTGGTSNQVWVNGVPSALSIGGASGLALEPSVFIGGYPGDLTNTGLSGTVACVGIYTDVAVKALVAAGAIPQFFPVGKTGPDEVASARFSRLGNFLRRPDMAFLSMGAPQPSLIGAQDTGGQQMLTAMCDALRLEEAILDAEMVAGVETVRAWMSSVARPAAPAVVVDVDADGSGVPVMSYDASGVAVGVTVKGFSTSATWVDAEAPSRWRDTSATLNAATDVVGDLRALAQFRSLLGRVSTLVPSKVTVDAVTSKNSLTPSLLALRPNVRVRVAGLPAAIAGYATIDCILTGVTEKHSLGRSLFELTLVPDLPYIEGVCDDTYALASEVPSPYAFSTRASGGNFADRTGIFPSVGIGTGYPGAISNVATSWNIKMMGVGLAPPAGDWNLPTGAPVDPLYLQIDSEIVQITNAAAFTSAQYTALDVYGSTVYLWMSDQTITVSRGALGTTAVAHNPSGGGIIAGGINVFSAQGTINPVNHVFLGMSSCATF